MGVRRGMSLTSSHTLFSSVPRLLPALTLCGQTSSHSSHGWKRKRCLHSQPLSKTNRGCFPAGWVLHQDCVRPWGRAHSPHGRPASPQWGRTGPCAGCRTPAAGWSSGPASRPLSCRAPSDTCAWWSAAGASGSCRQLHGCACPPATQAPACEPSRLPRHQEPGPPGFGVECRASAPPLVLDRPTPYLF